MKVRIIVLLCLVSVIALSINYANAQEGSKPGSHTKIGIVSIQRIFRDCKKSTAFQKQVVAEQKKVFMELDKLTKELEVTRSGLNALKEGSSDYLSLIREILTKQGSLQVKQEIYKQEMILKQQTMIAELYKDILREVSEVAKMKGLEVILEKSEIPLSELKPKEIEQVITTNKVLYSTADLDITKEVIARLDAIK